MKQSTERILTTHVGSMPRPQYVVDQLFAQDKGEAYDPNEFDKVMTRAVAEIAQKQVGAGVDIISDGEMSKISYATYIRHRLTGFEIAEVPVQPLVTSMIIPNLSDAWRNRVEHLSIIVQLCVTKSKLKTSLH